jgi:hypothetical protein
MNTYKIADVVSSYKEKNGIDKNSFLGKEFTAILSILDHKKVSTIEQLKSKGPAVLVKAFPGFSVNRVNLLYEAIGEDVPFDYVNSVLVKPISRFVLKDKYK